MGGRIPAASRAIDTPLLACIMRSKSKVDFKFRCVVRASGARREAYFFCWSFICRLFPRVCLVFFPWLGRVLVAGGGGGGDVAGRNWCSFRASESAFSARHWNIFVPTSGSRKNTNHSIRHQHFLLGLMKCFVSDIIPTPTTFGS